MPRLLLLSLCGLGLLLAPLLALSGAPEASPEVELRLDPAKHALLTQRAQEFLALPPERQQQLRQLDHDLQKLPLAERDHLFQVMRRYARWLSELPEDQRRQITAAPNAQQRLECIRRLRQQQWAARLPRSQRQQLAGLPEPERQQKLTELRKEEHLWQVRWQMAVNHWADLQKHRTLPTRLQEFPAEVSSFVKEYLLPTLSPREQKMLQQAEGQWPLFPCTLVALADRHPVALPGKCGPKTFAELPREVQRRLRNKNLAHFEKQLRSEEGKWPDYAEAVADIIRNRNQSWRGLPEDFWPTLPEHLSTGVHTFLINKLMPQLTEDEANRLQKAEGAWPDYPQTIQELAQQHQLEVPWQTLPPIRTAPDRRNLWDRYRLDRRLLDALWEDG